MSDPPLVQAAWYGDLDKVERLLARGEDVNQRGEYGWTALMRAIINHHNRMMTFLMEHDECDIECSTDDGTTPLIVACLVNNVTAVTELLQRRVDIDATDCDGNTALHSAASAGSTDCVTMLLNQGAALKKNNDGKTAVDLARENNHLDVVNIFNSILHSPFTTNNPHTPTQSQYNHLQQTVNQQRAEIEELRQQVSDNKELTTKLQMELQNTNVQLNTELQQAGEKIQQLEISHGVLEAALVSGRQRMVDERYLLVTGQRDLSDSHFGRIADEMGDDWKRLGVILGVKAAAVQRMDRNHPGDCWMACVNLLANWRESPPGSVDEKRQALIEALVKIGKEGIVHLV